MSRLPIPGLPGWEMDPSGVVFHVTDGAARRVASGPDGLVVARSGNTVTSFRVADVAALLFPTDTARLPGRRRARS